MDHCSDFKYVFSKFIEKNSHLQSAELALIVSSIVRITYNALTEFAGSNITQCVNVFILHFVVNFLERPHNLATIKSPVASAVF